MLKMLLLVGTRPEAIKLAPVAQALRARPAVFQTKICASGQHEDMLSQALADFALVPDRFLKLSRRGQGLGELSARLFDALDVLLAEEEPDWLVVQGDTTTVMVAALSAFYRRIPLAHVEAGLRSGDRFAPFPEEINRRVASLTADLHFAPTAGARENLLREGVAPETVHVTGNTVIDALLATCAAARHNPPVLPPPVEEILAAKQRIILVTCHRRESFGPGLAFICAALRSLALRNPEARIVYPVHPNPQVRGPVQGLLAGIPGILLTDPIAYRPFVRLLAAATIVLTDSGGIQEEAPSLDVPVLVMRELTERPEGVAAGCSRLVGTDSAVIVREVERLLRDPERHRQMAAVANPYGDGSAGERIADILARTGRIRL